MGSDSTQRGRFGYGFLLKVLGVDAHEARLVFPLLLHNFFLGVGIAFLFTSSSAVFLHSFEGKDLALAFVVAGILMLGVARAYAHFEHKFKLQTYLPAVVLAIALIVLLVRLAGYVIDHAVMAFAMLVAYRIVYLLANLEFWGFASLIFNVRQSKRLFGLIGSGAIPAKMLGYLAVALLSKSVELENLLYVSVVAFLASFLILRRLLAKPEAKASLNHEHPKHAHKTSPDSFLLRIFGNKFILALSVFAFLSAIVMGMVDFSFYGKVKHHYHDSHDLAAFLGTFMMLAMGITFTLKLLMSGKLINRLGVKGVLISLPIALMIPSAILLLPLDFSADEKNMLWFFSMLYLFRDVLKYSLLDPLFLALFQPMDAHSRLKGHTIVKGFIDPLGLILIGGLLYLGEHNFAHSMYFLLAGGIVIVSVPWLWSCWHLNKEGLKVLKGSLRKRFLDGQSLPFVGKTIAELLTEKLNKGTASEGIYALRMLENNPHADYKKLLNVALRSPWPDLQLYALQMLEGQEAILSTTQLAHLAMQGENEDLQALATKLLLKSLEGRDRFDFWLNHENDAIKKGAIAGLIGNSNTEAAQMGLTLMQQMIASEVVAEQIMGLWLMGETKQKSLSASIPRLLQAAAPDVVNSAIQVSGKLEIVESLPILIQLLRNPRHRGETIDALQCFPLEAVLAASALHPEFLPLICKVAGWHASNEAIDFLLDQLNEASRDLQREALDALTKMDFHDTQRPELKAHFIQLHHQLAADLQQYNLFWEEKEETIAAALEVELHALVDQMMMTLAMQYDRSLMMRARQGIRFKGHEYRAGALEILDQVLPRAQSIKLMPLLEQLYLNRRSPSTKPKGKKSILEACRNILKQGSAIRNAWTICIAAEFYRLNEGNIDSVLLNNSMREKTPFLTEYAYWLQTNFDITLENYPMNALKTSLDSFSPIEIVLMLKASSIFSGTPDNILAEVAAIANAERITSGDVLFKKGDPGDCLYVIAEGSISIGDGSTEFAKLGKNDFFGELALVETEPRSADAVGLTDCLLLRIDQDDFYELIEDRIEVARGILVILAQRLRKQNDQLHKLENKLAQNVGNNQG